MLRINAFAGCCLALTLGVAAGIAPAGCCPTVSGPSAPAESHSGRLAPGEFQFYDVDTPRSTTQINLDFTLDSTTIPLRLRQIDPSCMPAADDACVNLYDSTMAPRPAGVLRFGNALQPHGASTRIVLQNLSPSETVSYSVTIAPHRAGCT